MSYNGQAHQTLCRVTPNNTFPNQVTCFGFLGRDLMVAIIGQYGTVSISPPNQWAATGTVYDSGATSKTFALTDGQVTSTSLTLTFSIAGVAHTFSGAPAATPVGTFQGVYTSAWMRGAVSFSVAGNGDIFGQGGGCTLVGAANQVDTFGLVLDLDLTNCGGPNGRYSGFGIHTGSVVVPRANETAMVAFVVTNGTRWMGGQAIR